MFSATDIASFLACRHTATLARSESKKEITKPFFNDPTLDLLRKLGLDHEQRYLGGLAGKDGFVIARIDVNGRWEDAIAETTSAMRKGADAVYQATFLDAQMNEDQPWVMPRGLEVVQTIAGMLALRSPSENFRFMAKRLITDETSGRKTIILGTPLYVAKDD